MTSVSELFHSRRLRFGRNSDAFGVRSDLASPPAVTRPSHSHRRHHYTGANQTRRDRLDPNGLEPLRRAFHHSREPLLHRPSYPSQERESSWPEEGSQQFSSGYVSHSESHSNVQDNLRSAGNDRLPGDVLLARERLLLRLRGVTLSGSRRNSMISSGNHHNDIAIEDDFRLVDAGDWETEISRNWLAAIPPLTNSMSQQTCRRPPGLTQEALNCLRVEVFCVPEESDEQGLLSRAFRDCSICLESFLEGDELIRLPCGHRYHFCCLDPWVRTCGDCPYCRRSIDMTTSEVKEDPEC